MASVFESTYLPRRTVGELHGQRRLAEHDEHNRMFARQDFEASLRQPFAVEIVNRTFAEPFPSRRYLRMFR